MSILEHNSIININKSNASFGVDEVADGLPDVIDDNGLSNNSTRRAFAFIVGMKFCATVFIPITVTGNFVAILAITKEIRRGHTGNLLLLSLATSDILIAIFVAPLYVHYMVNAYWDLGAALCHIWCIADWALVTCNQFTIFLITLDRYLKIVEPISYRNWKTGKKVGMMIGAAWFFPFIFFTPVVVLLKPVGYVHRPNQCEIAIVSNAAVGAVLMLLLYWPITLLIIFLYYRIYVISTELLTRSSQTQFQEISSIEDPSSDRSASTHIDVHGRGNANYQTAQTAVDGQKETDFTNRASLRASFGTALRTNRQSFGTSLRTNREVNMTDQRQSFGTTLRTNREINRSSVRTSLGTSLRASVRTSLGTNLRSSVGTNRDINRASVRTSLGTNLRSSVGTNLRSSVGTSLGTNLSPNTPTNTIDQTYNIGSSVDPPTYKPRPTKSKIKFSRSNLDDLRMSVVSSKNLPLQKKAYKTITLLLAAYLCFSSPFAVVIVLRPFCGDDCVPRVIYDIFYGLYYVNAAFNPFLYAKGNKTLWRSMIRILFCRRIKR